LRALLRLLTNICSKDLVGFLSDCDGEGSPDIAEVHTTQLMFLQFCFFH